MPFLWIICRKTRNLVSRLRAAFAYIGNEKGAFGRSSRFRSSMDNNNASRGGIGFLGMLGILFIGLKLTGVIDWSWWLVLAPLWIPWGIVLVGILVIGICSYMEKR